MEEIINKIPRPEHPRPDFERENWLNLNGAWSFTFDDDNLDVEGNSLINDSKVFNKTIIVPFSWTSPLSGINEDKKGTGWYRKTSDWSNYPENSRIFLNFGAVDYTSYIWVNGVLVGSHTGGYSNFELEITSVWKRDEENQIVVRTEDTDESYQQRGKQSYGEIRGIWQTVWLEARPLNYLNNVQFITKLDGTIQVKGNVISGSDCSTILNFKLDDLVHSLELNLKEGRNEFKTQFKIPSPKLWSPEKPNLYFATVEIKSKDVCLSADKVSVYFGIREIGVLYPKDKDYSFITLNNKRVYLNGVLDQAFYQEGYFTAPSDEEFQEDIWRLKRLGINLMRIHIKPEEPRKLYYADKMGMLVMEDMPCYWGPPELRAKKAFESEMEAVINRDINHPSIISWVIFNETWGLEDIDKEDKKIYSEETQQWVKQTYLWAKEKDGTRLIEDNSPCKFDHIVSDINSWHFYSNGYERVRKELKDVTEQTYPGSTWNYINGNKQNGVPLMNSECGAVWGVQGSAGESDISWQYKYMINEIRKHEKICGFVFTQFHDVVNEFNGYYRIDNKDKYFGYEDFCEGMTIKDLHSPNFIVIDAPPCRTLKTEEEVVIPLLASSYSDVYHNQKLTLEWELWYNNFGTKVVISTCKEDIEWKGYEVFSIGDIFVKMPKCDSMVVFALKLRDSKQRIITRNFICFDVQSSFAEGCYALEGDWFNVKPKDFISKVWDCSWNALGGNKVNGGHSGYFEYKVNVPEFKSFEEFTNMELIFEAGAKRILQKDLEKDEATTLLSEMDFVQGARQVAEANKNSYFMTDEDKHTSKVEILINDQLIDTIFLPDDPADSRGVLSWHNQPDNKWLEEAGSYGYLYKVNIPSRLVAKIIKQGSFDLKFNVPKTSNENEGGLALYGRNSGRYPMDIMFRCV
ncbi:MAG TPA: glycoside hydrolase family 2 TIM barrel-domain containing protein [Ruminiclostridium sp.]